MVDGISAEADPINPNEFEVAGRDLYRALGSMYEHTSGPYPRTFVTSAFAPFRQDGGEWAADELPADRFTRGNITILSHPKCLVTGVLEHAEHDPSAYVLHVARTEIDPDTYLYTYQDLSLRTYELKAQDDHDLGETLALGDVLVLDSQERRINEGLPSGVQGILLFRYGRIALGDSPQYPTAIGEAKLDFEDSVGIAARMTRDIDRIGLPKREFRAKYGTDRGYGGDTLAGIGRAAATGMSQLRHWRNRKRN